MTQRKIKIESEVPCVFSETGTHRVTMLFAEVETELREGYREGLQLMHLSCECGEDAAEIGEALDDGTKCCGLVRDDVRLAASGEDPREHDPIIANALAQIRANNVKTHRMRAARRKPGERVMDLERDVNRVLPPGFKVGVDRWGTRPIGLVIYDARRYSRQSDMVLARYVGRGAWKMHERFDERVRAIAADDDTQLRIKYRASYNRAMDSVTCLGCGVKMNPASRMSHLESARHLKRVRARLNDAMMLVSARLGRRWL